MRVGFDMTAIALNRAGERRYAQSLLHALRARDDVEPIELAFSRRAAAGGLSRVVHQAAVEAVHYPFLLGRRARRAGVDLVHHPRHLVPPELGLPGPSIVTVHDVLPLSRPEHFSGLILHRYRALARSAVGRAALVLTGSLHSAGELTARLGVPAERIRVTPYGVGDRFRPVPVEPGDPYVLFVGTLEPRKNLTGAVAAFEAVADDFPGHRLVVVGGTGWKRGELERALGSSAARIDRRGHVSDEELVRLYSGADCFLFPTLGEGFGFPLLEAMACGAPVVASDRDGLPELAGGAAVLAEPEDADALAGALASVLSSAERRAELRERGLARAGRFSWAECARLTVDAYGDALAG